MKNGDEGIKNKIKQRMESREASLSITDDIEEEESIYNIFILKLKRLNTIP